MGVGSRPIFPVEGDGFLFIRNIKPYVLLDKDCGPTFKVSWLLPPRLDETTSTSPTDPKDMKVPLIVTPRGPSLRFSQKVVLTISL